MNDKKWILILLVALNLFLVTRPNHEVLPEREPEVEIVETPPLPVVPQPPQITTSQPGYLNYDGIVKQLQEWDREAPDFSEIGVYGRSSGGLPLYYFRICNEKDTAPKPTVLITACIHGNEPHSTATVMAWVGNLLDSYSKDENIKKLIHERIIYVIPVVCPDSYPDNRHCDGTDPNRNFPNPQNPNLDSIPPVKALQEFYLKTKPQAVLSGHTFGRMILIPWGNRKQVSPNHADFERIAGAMASSTNYRLLRACEIYGTPIYGGELDWFYEHGSFAIVFEFGTHQRIPNKSEINHEFNLTWKAFLKFIDEAPLVKIRSVTSI